MKSLLHNMKLFSIKFDRRHVQLILLLLTLSLFVLGAGAPAAPGGPGAM